MKSFITFLLLIGFWGSAVFGQSKQEKHIDSLIVIGSGYLSKPDSLARYAHMIYELSNQNKYTKGHAYGAKILGISAFYQAKYAEAIDFYKEALSIYTELQDTLEMGKAYYNIAMAYSNKADQENMMKYALDAVRIFDDLKHYIGNGRVYNLLGIYASRHNDQQKAATYFKRFIHYAKLAKDTLEIATGYNNLGSTYTELNEPDSALQFLNEALAMYVTSGFTRNLAGTYDNIATLLEKQGRIAEAIENLEKAVELAVAENNKYREAGAQYNLGRLYNKLGQLQRALPYLNRSAALAREIKDNYQLSFSLKQLAYVYSDLGQYKRAYDFLNESTIYRDSVFNEELTKSNEELKTKYETEKKEQEIVALSQENLIKTLQLRQRNTWLMIAVSVIILIGFGAWLRIRNRKLRAEANLQQELAKKQEEAALAVLKAEERERTRIAADLHDGVGQILSAALLNLNQVNRSVESGELPSPEVMKNAIGLVKDSYNEMREISHQMMPNALLKAGLAYSIREFINKVSNERLKIHLDIVGFQTRLDQQTEIMLYRSIQEAVNNVIKHAEANRLSIQLVNDKDGISVSIEDNGKGFNARGHSQQDGIGLKNMRSRIALLKGSIEIDSTVGKGTVLMINIPSLQ
jgi:two-component system NarL family sensor kinase